MIQNHRGKKHKDTESASETIISNIGLINSHIYSAKMGSAQNITLQQLDVENFDNYIEKLNK
jgi:hypothetical protein